MPVYAQRQTLSNPYLDDFREAEGLPDSYKFVVAIDRKAPDETVVVNVDIFKFNVCAV